MPTCHNLLSASAYQREMLDSKLSFQLFDKSCLRCLDLWKTLDTVCVSLRRDSIGAVQQHAAVISPADEALMWVSGTLGMERPGLLCVPPVFSVGFYFCLRGGQERRDFIYSQPIQTSDGACGKKIFYCRAWVKEPSRNISLLNSF